MTLIACPDCDLLHQRQPLPVGGTARCTRCDAVLYRDNPAEISRHLALVIAALLLFVLANSHPVVTMDLQGQQLSCTLWDAVWVLHDKGLSPLSVVVFLTALVFPLLDTLLLLLLLWPLAQGRPVWGGRILLRVIQRIRPWSMMDVLFLSMLIAVVKLANTAEVIPGVALWSFAALTLLLAALAALEPRTLWERLIEVESA